MKKKILTALSLVSYLLLFFPASSQTAYEYFQKGREAYDKMDYATAVTEYKKAIQLQPSYKEVHWNLGACYYYLNDYRSSVASYTTAISYYTDYSDLSKLYRWRGSSKEALQEFDGALQDYNSAISYDSYYGDAYWARGLIYQDYKKDFQKAIDDYKKALSSYSSDKANTAILYRNICDCYLDLKDYQEAISNCTKAVENNSGYREAYWSRGIAYANAKKYTESISDYTKALSYYSSDPASLATLYSNIALNQIDLGQYDEAIGSLKKSIEYNPEYKNAYWNTAEAYYYKEAYDDAIKWYTQAIDRYKGDFPNLSTLYYWRAKSRSGKKDYNTAIADLSKAIEYKPDFGSAYWDRAYYYEKMLKFSKAVAEYKNTLAYYQDDKKNLSILYTNIGGLEANRGRYTEAIANYNKALEISPDKFSLYTDIGDVYMKKKDYTSAADYYTRKIEADTAKNANLFTWSLRGYCYIKSNEKTKAETDLNNAYNGDAKIDTCYLSAFSKYFLGEKTTAFSILNSRLQKASAANKPNRYYDLARLFALDNKETEAINNLDAAIKAGYTDYSGIYKAWEFDLLRTKPSFANLTVKYKIPKPE